MGGHQLAFHQPNFKFWFLPASKCDHKEQRISHCFGKVLTVPTPRCTVRMKLDKVTILSKLGGEPALVAAVDQFYSRLLEEDQLKEFFEGRNIARLKAHQLNFMRFAFTQIPEGLDVPDLILTKHEELFKMGMNGTHFDLVAGHFVATLEGLKVDADTISEAVAVISPLRTVFVQGAAKYGKKSCFSRVFGC